MEGPLGVEKKCNCTVPIPKKGGAGVYKMDKFRGRCLVSVPNKVMCSIINGRSAQVIQGKNLVADK